jgi:hypothetical protein
MSVFLLDGAGWHEAMEVMLCDESPSRPGLIFAAADTNGGKQAWLTKGCWRNQMCKKIKQANWKHWLSAAGRRGLVNTRTRFL